MTKLNENLIHLRKKASLSQLALAKITGLSKSSISRWEAGASRPSVDAVVKICKSLGITTDSLLLTKPEIHKLQTTNKSLSQRLKKIESLNVKEQEKLFSIIDAYLRSTGTAP